jgi:hypothetical protein
MPRAWPTCMGPLTIVDSGSAEEPRPVFQQSAARLTSDK